MIHGLTLYNKTYFILYMCSILNRVFEKPQYNTSYNIKGIFLPTKYLLTKMKIKDSNLCSFCTEEIETLVHLFWKCRLAQLFWNDFKAFLTSKNITKLYEWKEQDIVFGSVKYDLVINKLIFRAKCFIYQRKLEDNILIFDNVKPYIKNI